MGCCWWRAVQASIAANTFVVSGPSQTRSARPAYLLLCCEPSVAFSQSMRASYVCLQVSALLCCPQTVFPACVLVCLGCQEPLPAEGDTVADANLNDFSQIQSSKTWGNLNFCPCGVRAELQDILPQMGQDNIGHLRRMAAESGYGAPGGGMGGFGAGAGGFGAGAGAGAGMGMGGAGATEDNDDDDDGALPPRGTVEP